MYFLNIISLVLLIGMSAVGPNLSQMCAYIDTRLATGTGTVDFLTKMGWSQFGSFFQNCMADGNGWVMNEI